MEIEICVQIFGCKILSTSLCELFEQVGQIYFISRKPCATNFFIKITNFVYREVCFLTGDPSRWVP
jgi:hypothetical protein